MHVLKNPSEKALRFKQFGTLYVIGPGETVEVSSDKRRKAVIARAKSSGVQMIDVSGTASVAELHGAVEGKVKAAYEAKLAKLEAESAALRTELAAVRAGVPGGEPAPIEDAPPPVRKKRAAKKKAPAKKKA